MKNKINKTWKTFLKGWKCCRCGGLSQDEINAALSQARKEGRNEAINEIEEHFPFYAGGLLFTSGQLKTFLSELKKK